MKLILKEKPIYDKINTIKDLLNYIQFHYDIDITFDNRQTNNYKLIVFDKTFGFNDYNGVINALKFLITCGDEK
jgi:hypothetical protein